MNAIRLSLVFLLFFLCSCRSEQSNTYMLIRKDMPYPDTQSYFSLWEKEEAAVKEKVMVSITQVMQEHEHVYDSVRSEWQGFSYIDRNDFIEDFLFRRKDKLKCKYFGTFPYKKYLEQHLAEDFVQEFVNILYLSPETRKKVDQDKQILYKKKEIAVSEDRPAVQESASGKEDRREKYTTYYYEKASQDAGISSDSEDEVIIKDVKKVLDW